MASLYERLVGDTPANPTPQESKIPLHGFRILLMRYIEGELTARQAFDALDLSAAQQAEAANIVARLNEVNNIDKRRRLLDWMFDDLALAELGMLPNEYKQEAKFNARFNSEKDRSKP